MGKQRKIFEKHQFFSVGPPGPLNLRAMGPSASMWATGPRARSNSNTAISNQHYWMVNIDERNVVLTSSPSSELTLSRTATALSMTSAWFHVVGE